MGENCTKCKSGINRGGEGEKEERGKGGGLTNFSASFIVGCGGIIWGDLLICTFYHDSPINAIHLSNSSNMACHHTVWLYHFQTACTALKRNKTYYHLSLAAEM